MSVAERLSAELQGSADISAAVKIFEQTILPYGYNSVDYASGPVTRWPMVDNLDWRPTIIFATYDWEQVYFGTDFQRHDRMLPYMLQQTTPWLYWDVWRTPSENPVTQELERRARIHVKSGLSIPFHGPGLNFAGVNLGSALPPEELEARDRVSRGEVFLLASKLHQHIRQRSEDASPPRLSARQAECLTWTAQGKTAWETATILSISESAVKKHLAAAAEALGARTGAHAVAVALSSGLISR